MVDASQRRPPSAHLFFKYCHFLLFCFNFGLPYEACWIVSKSQAYQSALVCFLIPIVLQEGGLRFHGPYRQFFTPFFSMRGIWQTDLAAAHVEHSSQDTTFPAFERYGRKCPVVCHIDFFHKWFLLHRFYRREDDIWGLFWLLHYLVKLGTCPIPFPH